MLTLQTATTDVASQSLLMRGGTSNARRKNERCSADENAKLANLPNQASLHCRTFCTTKPTLVVFVQQGRSSTALASTCSSMAIASQGSKHQRARVATVTCEHSVFVIPTVRHSVN